MERSPRPSLFSPLMLAALLLGAGFFVGGAGGVASLTWSGGPVWDDWILDARGVSATATGVDLPSPSRHVRPGVQWSRAEVDVTLPSGESARATVWLDGPRLEAARRGEPIPVVADPANPSRARPAGGFASLHGHNALLPAAFAVGGLSVVGLGLLLGLRRAFFLINAEVSRGVVESVESWGKEGSTQTVHLSFPGPDGSPVRGSAWYNGKIAAADPVWVAWHRRSPARCEIVGLART